MSKKQQLLVLGSLFLAVFLVYGNAIFNSFVWDDGYLIVDNPFIKNIHFIKNLFCGDLIASTVEAHRDSGYYRPLSMLSFMLDYHIWKLNPQGFHLTNILIHFLNSVLVFYILYLLSKNWTISFLASLFFAIHPIHVEAVTPIYNRMGIQGTFFALMAWAAFIHSENFKKVGFLIASLIVFFLGILSKEDVIVLPFIFLLYDFYYFSNLDSKKLIKKEKIVFYATCFCILGIYFFIRKLNVIQQFSFLDLEGLHPALAGHLLFHVLTVFRIVGGYVFKVIFFTPLLPLYWIDPVKSILDAGAWAGAGIFLSLIFLSVYLYKKNKDISFFILFFLISLLPFLNIFPIGESYTFHERFLYLPSLAVCFVIAFIGLSLFENTKQKMYSKIFIETAFATLIFYFAITVIQSNYIWRTNLSLWKNAVEKIPESRTARLNLGQAYMDKGNYDKAALEIAKSLSLSAKELLSGDMIYLAKLNLAKIYTDNKMFDKAANEITDALRVASQAKINPYAAYDKLGLLNAASGNKLKAKEAFEQALAYNKNFVTGLYNLGVLYYELGDYKNAEDKLNTTFKLNPDFEYAPYALGLTYLAIHKIEKAEAMFYQALKINPGFDLARKYYESLKKE